MATDKKSVGAGAPGANENAADSLPAGTLFSRYKIVRELGRGGMGAVYEVQHVDLHKRFALKVLNKSYANDAQMRERFMREGRAASRIRHPHVVDVSDVGTHEGVPYLVMEFLEGEDLAHTIFYEKTLAFERVVEIMLPVLAAVSTAHDEGVIHRDLKPDNIFLARTRQGHVVPKVLDFGISKLADSPDQLSLTSTGSFLGTPHYISPEQARRASNVDARSDQYSLGVILYEAVTGRLPYEAEAMYDLIAMLVVGEFDPPRKHRPDLPPGLEAVILRAMAHKPENRFPSVRSLGRALLPFGSENTRAIWTPTFQNAAAVSLPPQAPADATEINPPPFNKPPAHDTHFDPNARPQMHTFANTAHEIDAPRNGARSVKLWAGLAAGALAIAATIAGVTALRSHPTPAAPPVAAAQPARVEHAPQPAPIAAPTPMPAPPPALAPALVPASRPPAPTDTAPTATQRSQPRARVNRPARAARPAGRGRHYTVD